MRKVVFLSSIIICFNHIHAGIFSRCFNGVGAVATASAMYFHHNTAHKAKDTTLKHTHYADQDLQQYVIQQADQMPNVRRDDVKNTALYRTDWDDDKMTYKLEPEGHTSYDFSNNHNILMLCHFHTDHPSALRHRQQYMVLAHELGHIYHKDVIHTYWKNHSLILGTSAIYPGISSFITSCIKSPRLRGLAFLPAAGTAIAGHVGLSLVACAHQIRNQERQADMFALQQSRCLSDIDAYYRFIEEAQDAEDDNSPTILRDHPSNCEMLQYINDYYQRKKQEGWKE